jgi:hypothetical protein
MKGALGLALGRLIANCIWCDRAWFAGRVNKTPACIQWQQMDDGTMTRTSDFGVFGKSGLSGRPKTRKGLFQKVVAKEGYFFCKTGLLFLQNRVTFSTSNTRKI